MKTNLSNPLAIVALAGLMLSVGCRKDHPGYARGEDFSTDSQLTQHAKIANAQAAAAARNDPALYACHFDGGKLNLLGQAKLDLLITSEDTVLPLTIYFTPAKFPRIGADQRESVAMYLKDSGLTESQYQLETGPSPASGTTVVQGIKALQDLNGTAAVAYDAKDAGAAK